MSSLNQFKIIFLGDAGVGKSSIIHRYIMEQFLVNPDSTLGTAFYCKTLMKHGEMVKLNIWDTSGEEKFRSLTNLYYQDADAAVLTYDLSKLESMDGVEYFKEELGENGPSDMGNLLSPNV